MENLFYLNHLKASADSLKAFLRRLLEIQVDADRILMARFVVAGC